MSEGKGGREDGWKGKNRGKMLAVLLFWDRGEKGLRLRE